MNRSPIESRLFVYGSLRKGSGNPAHRWLAEQADLLGRAWCRGRLYLVAGYPGMILSDDPGNKVLGEVYRLHDPARALGELDRYEECGPGFAEPTEYRRQLITVDLADQGPCRAWVYVYNRGTDRLTRIDCGDYFATGPGPL